MTLIINGERVDDDLISDEKERMRPHYQEVFREQPPGDQEKQLWEWARENLIERTVLRQHLKKDKRPVEQKKIEESFRQLADRYGGKEQFLKHLKTSSSSEEDVKKDIEIQLRLESLFEENCRELQLPAEDEIRQYYQDNRDQYMIPEQVRAAHIVKYVDDKTLMLKAYQEISEIKKLLDQGEKFEELADSRSDCPGNGGDLGYFARGKMVQEFEDAVFELEVGETSDIIRSSYGYHIARLYDKRPAKFLKLEQVQDEIRQLLLKERQEKKNEELIDKLVAQSDIRTD